MTLKYPTWRSLACDYLSIMATSVSSERVFSGAGITISKQRGQLGDDVVKATQFLKAAIKKDTLFRDAEPSLALEEELGFTAEEGEEETSEVEVVEGKAADKKEDEFAIVFDDDDSCW